MKYPIRASLLLAVLVAFIVVASLYALQKLWFPDLAGGMFHRIVWGNVISPVILGLFVVAVSLLLSKRRLLRREKRLSGRFLSDIGPKLFDANARIEDVTIGASKFRTNLLAQRWSAYQFYRETDQATGLDKHTTVAETEHMLNSFSVARFFVWALPIVGFIGTVWGIGLSISFFSDTMSSSQAGASVSALLQENIPLVTRGLSTAFDTTLLALVLSVPATGFLVLTERNEREYLLAMDQSWRRFMATRTDALDELEELDIDLADHSEHAQAVDESLREFREEAFDRFQKRLPSGE